MVLPVAVSFGCKGPSSTVELVSYKDPSFPEPYLVEFAECAYRLAPGRDIHVAGRSEELDRDGTPLRQYLHVHIYWKPHPGKTHANATATNALLRYVVATADGVATYAGTGFAFPKKKKLGNELQIEIESARLHLASQTGDLPDFLGQTTVAGTLSAMHDSGRATQLVREMELLAAR